VADTRAGTPSLLNFYLHFLSDFFIQNEFYEVVDVNGQKIPSGINGAAVRARILRELVERGDERVVSYQDSNEHPFPPVRPPPGFFGQLISLEQDPDHVEVPAGPVALAAPPVASGSEWVNISLEGVPPIDPPLEAPADSAADAMDIDPEDSEGEPRPPPEIRLFVEFLRSKVYKLKSSSSSQASPRDNSDPSDSESSDSEEESSDDPQLVADSRRLADELASAAPPADP
jgi:hypothetical protein